MNCSSRSRSLPVWSPRRFGCLVLSERLPAHHRQDETYNVVRLVASIFVVMTSLVLGLLVNSSKNTFEAIDRNVHAFSTELILLDRTLRNYGPEAADVRKRLRAYVRQAINGTWGVDGSPVLEDRAAETLLDEVGSGLMAMRPSDPVRHEMWREAEAQLSECGETALGADRGVGRDDSDSRFLSCWSHGSY